MPEVVEFTAREKSRAIRKLIRENAIVDADLDSVFDQLAARDSNGNLTPHFATMLEVSPAATRVLSTNWLIRNTDRAFTLLEAQATTEIENDRAIRAAAAGEEAAGEEEGNEEEGAGEGEGGTTGEGSGEGSGDGEAGQ